MSSVLRHYGIDPRKYHDLQIPQGPPPRSIQTPSDQSGRRQERMRPQTQQIPRRPPVAAASGDDRANKAFDDFIRQMKTTALHVALEQPLRALFDATGATAWFTMKDRKRLFCPQKGRSVTSDRSIVSECLTTGKVLRVEKGSAHPKYDLSVDSSSALLVIPLKNEHDEVVVVVQVCNSKRTFDSAEVDVAETFAKKFQIYSHLVMRGEVALDDIPNDGALRSMASEIAVKLKRKFNCRAIEFWSVDPFESRYLKYDVRSGEFEPAGQVAGVVSQVLETEMVTTIDDVTKAKRYDREIDGTGSVLMGNLNISDIPYAVILRAREDVKFGHGDEIVLQQLIPLFAKITALSGMQSDTQEESKMMENGSELAERLQALLSVAEIISGVLDIDMLIPTIMERSCVLLNTERCSLFLIDQAKQELVSRFQGGLRKSIRLPLNRGIVGYTATTGHIVNIPDAYEDERFDKNVDLITGYRTKTILTVPIYNNRGEIAGVTEMINKRDDGEFDEDDVKMMMAFNVFCGISLDNARLYEASLDLTRQLRSFVEMSTALNKTMKINDVLEEILTNARSVVGASRATVFMKNSEGEWSPFCSIGESVVYGIMFAQEAVTSKKAVSFTREEVFYRAQVGDIKVDEISSTVSSSLTSTKSLARVSSVLMKDPLASANSVSAEIGNVCDFPMMKNDEVIGVMELSCPGKILPEDLKILDCFAVFAAVSIERSELQEIAQLGEVEVVLKQHMTDEERRLTEIPAKLRIENETLRNAVYRIGFDVKAYDDIGRFRVLFLIAHEFELLETFKVPNEKWFRFLLEVSQTYKKVPYHNWYHAVDVTQFVTYQIKTVGFDKVLNKFELFGFIIAAICHDANHDGFTNVYNEKAETPLGILFKNQSVMETHHCAIAISIIAKEECNLFSNLTSQEYRNMWTLIIRLILITDMAKHFDFLKQVNGLLDQGPINTDDYDNRVMCMQLILKCADISNVSRPFELADRWCDVLCEEFFRQGDLEMANGMEYTSPLNDREHLDKPKSQIGFYTFVCLPLFEAAARAFPPLQVNVDQVKSNLAVWKAATAAREAEEARIAASSKAEGEKKT